MKYFLKMIDTFNEKRVLNFKKPGHTFIGKNKHGYSQSEIVDSFIKFSSKCRPFIFTPSGEEYLPKNYPESVTEIEDAPFECFSIELSGDRPITSPNPEDLLDSKYAQVDIWCMMVCEFSPKDYAAFLLVRHKDLWGVLASGDENPETNGLIQHYIDRISKEKSGLEIVNVKQKIGSGKLKTFHKIKSVIHITGSPAKYSGSYGSREVDWTHRFEVRGHWRKVSGIGKDRQGNYGTEGFTWISSYVKGSDDLPLIKKQRVVQDDGS